MTEKATNSCSTSKERIKKRQREKRRLAWKSTDSCKVGRKIIKIENEKRENLGKLIENGTHSHINMAFENTSDKTIN